MPCTGGGNSTSEKRFLDVAILAVEVGRDGFGGFGRFAFSLAETFERQKDHGGVGLVRAGEQVEAGDGEGRLYAGRFAGDVGHAGEHGVGAVDRRRVGELQGDDQVALILLWDETDGNGFEPEVGEHQQPGVDRQHGQPQTNDVREDVNVSEIELFQAGIKEAKEPAEREVEAASEQIRFRGMGLEDQRGERGTEGE